MPPKVPPASADTRDTPTRIPPHRHRDRACFNTQDSLDGQGRPRLRAPRCNWRSRPPTPALGLAAGPARRQAGASGLPWLWATPRLVGDGSGSHRFFDGCGSRSCPSRRSEPKLPSGHLEPTDDCGRAENQDNGWRAVARSGPCLALPALSGRGTIRASRSALTGIGSFQGAQVPITIRLFRSGLALPAPCIGYSGHSGLGFAFPQL